MKKFAFLFLALGMFSGMSFADNDFVDSGSEDVIEDFGGTRSGE